MAESLIENRFDVSLAERVRPRIAVEKLFAKMGHTYRHGPAFRFFDHKIMRPGLRLGLRAAGLYGLGSRNTLRAETREIVLKFPELPAAFDGFRVLHLSDFHIDGVPGLVDSLEKLLPQFPVDLCVFTGDYRFEDRGPCDAVYPMMRRVVNAISSRHGIFGILGNHDAAEIAFGLEEMGVRMLVNDASEVRVGRDSIWIAGVDDPFDYRCANLPLALERVPANAFKILLAHAPEVHEEAARLGVQLYLSGHTHAGQIRLPYIGAIKHNSHCPPHMAHGLWQEGAMQGYTTSGIGCSSVPVRFHCPPELVVIELRRG